MYIVLICDALNAVLYEDWEQLHPKWNMQTSLIFERHPAPNEKYERQYKEGNEKPSIVHFTGHMEALSWKLV
ncbi:hypothetical protein EfmAA610_15980 [Enterococcus faecium]|nr:hypothetical protein EfmAA610_15980 [Enterococcus faecium]